MNDDLATLIDGLESADATTRASAAQKLATLGQDSAAAAVSLVRCNGDEHEEVREWASAALEECGPPAADNADALANLLTGTVSDVAYWAATLLGRLTDEATPIVVDRLIAALQQRSEPAVRQRIVWALGEIGGAACDALPLLQSITADADDPRLQRLAKRVCDQIPP